MALIDMSLGANHYVERSLLTRSPATPAAPSGKSSESASGQTAPAEGTTLAGDGLLLTNVQAVALSVYANATKTFSGAGTGACWVYNPYQAQWCRCSELDVDLTDAAGMPAKMWVREVPSRLGMLLNWIWDSVTVSGGTDFLLRIDGYSSVPGAAS